MIPIKANIAFRKHDATDNRNHRRLKIANAYEFVKDLPLGIHTNIGDKGNKLSGGQNNVYQLPEQKKKIPIMILDEATSALIQKEKIH
jgi:subfamily B ATP-binding cassette protein MsbA